MQPPTRRKVVIEVYECENLEGSLRLQDDHQWLHVEAKKYVANSS